MFKRKLEALEYGEKELNIRDDIQWKRFIVWIEDHKIRFYTIEDRGDLRTSSGDHWTSALKQYLTELQCPYIDSDRPTILDWLLGHAIKLTYGEDVDKFRAVTAESIKEDASTDDPLAHLNPTDSNFKAGLASVCRLLNMPEHYDQEVTLRGVSVLIKQRLSRDARQAQTTETKEEGVEVTLEDCPLGFDTNDKMVNEACKILRLLHINELRELQTKINEAIVSAQGITANPKTDERLGKVGRM